MNTLPEEFLSRMRDLLGGEFERFIESYSEPPRHGLRVNTLKLKTADEIKALLPVKFSPVAWCAEGLSFPNNTAEPARPSKHWAYHAGLYYIQEPSAMSPVAVLDARPGDTVLDICAAPGGKSVQLAGRLNGRGALISNDASASRCGALIKNLELAGVTNAVVLNEKPGKLAGRFGGYFDKILVDAPCSGEGMFRRDPDAAKAWAANKPEACARMQREILHFAALMVKPGGCIAYSTCTFNTEENEGVIENFLKTHSNFTLIPVGLKTGGIQRGLTRPNIRPDVAFGAARIWPHRAEGEGHFIALLQRKPETADNNRRKPAWRVDILPKGEISRDAFKPFKQFADGYLAEGFNGLKGRLNYHGQSLFLTPEGLPGLNGLRVMRNGWYLGDIPKGRFVPSQALAMGLIKDEARFTAELPDNESIYRFLRGESPPSTVPSDSKPWVLVCARGHPLGWARLVDGKLKNHRPTGWAVK